MRYKELLIVSVTVNIILLVGLSTITLQHKWKTDRYYAGKYGEICYPEGQKIASIKHPIYFDSLIECNNYINNK